MRAKRHLQFLRLQEAVVKIQALLRGWMVRRQLREMHVAATVIQAAFRMHRARRRYRALARAAVLVQQWYRARRATGLRRECHLGQKCAAVVLPATCEGVRARRPLREQHRAAAVVQSTDRGPRQCLLHQRLGWAPDTIQEKHRVSEEKALEHGALPRAAACAQAGFQDTRVGRPMQEQHQAAAVIQKHFRAFRTRRRHLCVRAAVVFVQRRYRAVKAARTEAATHLQSPCRALGRTDVQRRHQAAACLQAFYRMHRARAAYRAKRRAAAVIQNRYRAWVRGAAERRQLSAVQKSAPTLQPACRGLRDRRELEKAPEDKKAAIAEPPASHCDGAGTQQDAAGSPVARPHTGAGVSLAAGSQSEAEGESPPASWEMATGTLETQQCAALRVQAFLRMAVCRSRFLLLRRAAVVVQNRCRACASARHQRRAYLQTRSSVVTIQAQTRGFLQRRRFHRIKDSTLKIQAAWRRYRARKHACEVRAACRIQAWYRGWRARKEYLAVLRAVRTVQRGFSAKQTRARFLNLRAAAVTIQRKWRAILSGRRAREHLMMKISEQRASVRLLRFTAAARCHLSALRIQRAYRRHVAVRTAAKHVDAVVCIQRWFRTRLRLKRLMQVCRGLADLQREAGERRRRDRAAAVIQAAVRRLLLRRKEEKLNRGIARAQALWRGYSLRKKSGCTKIGAIRRSLRAINGEVREEDKLYKRTALALHYLLTYKHLSAILEALKHLEVVTRLSPLCCENMARSGAILKIFALIRSCNRSVPCMEVVSYAVQVLLHVAKYERTTPAVYDVEGSVDTLLELLKRYRGKPGDRVPDKSGSIFTKTCCLLAVLLQATSRASDVRNRSKVVDCVYSIYKLTAHKHRVDTERTLCKQNQNSSLSGSSIPETPVRTRVVARLKPGWVLRRDTLEEITNPLQAIQMVMETLGLPC